MPNMWLILFYKVINSSSISSTFPSFSMSPHKIQLRSGKTVTRQ